MTPTHSPALSPAQAHLDGPFCLHEPAAQHGLDVHVAQLAADLQDLLLDLILQQEAAQAPVQEGSCSLPFQNVLRTSPRPESPERGQGVGGW